MLGWLWSLINPASMLLIYSLVFGTFLKVPVPVAGNGHTQLFALYLFTALVVWNFFSNVVNGSMLAMIAAGPLLKRVAFPAACPVVANTLSVLVQTAVEASILLAFLIAVNNVSLTFLLLIPILLLLVVFSLGIGLMLSVFNVYYRDVGYLATIGLNLAFYATPIIYSFDIIPEHVGGWIPARTIISLNPLTQFVSAARDVMYTLQVPTLGRSLALVASAVLSMTIGSWVFSRLSPYVSEEL
jgi:ABC-2 type transport system permease protein